MSKLSLSFGTPEHGWLSVALSCEGKEQVLDVSDVPSDSLRLLATAALNLVAGWDSTVTWYLEPDEVTWSFHRHGERCQLTVQGPGHGATPEVFAAGTMREICTPIWRALRRLEADPAWNASAASSCIWSYPFPAKEVAILGDRLREESAR